jgi:hypothetical protein
MHKPPSQKILLTPSFKEYLQVHFLNSYNYLLKKYYFKDLGNLGTELHNISQQDEEFLNETLNEFLIDLKYDAIH